MTTGADLGLITMDVLLAYYGVSVTYTEAVSGIAQPVTALEENFQVDGHTVTVEFSFETTDLTIANWRGASITASNGDVFKVTDKEDSDGHTRFTAVRDLERS